nr:hypothetical protein [Tanacetum cinerariifolium]
MMKKPSIPRRNKVNWHYIRDDILFSTIKVVSRHQNTQQYGAILPIELTNEDIRNTKAYKGYYACATEEATPKPKASAKRKRGGSDSSTTPPTAVASPRPITTVAAASRLTTAAKGKQPARATSPNDPSEHGGSSTDEGTDVDAQDKGRDDDESEKNDESNAGKDDDDDDDDDEEEIAKLDEQEDTKSGEGDDKETKSDGESEEEETREEEDESFDPIPRTPKDSEDNGNGKEDQRLRGRGLQVSQDIEDSHVTLTPVKPDGASSRKYTTSVTKTKAADYGHIKWIEDLVPRTMWIQEPLNYDKHALWGVSHWGRKHQQFYGFAVNRESALDVYSKRRIIAVTDLKIVEWHNYKHLDWISIRRDDDKIYKFKEGNFKRLRLQDIKDILLLLVQGKLSNLTVKERFAFNVSLRMFTRSIVIQRRMKDLQLGVKSYQKRLNLTKPDTYRSDLKRCEAYTAYSNPRGFIYQNKDKKNRLMRIDELHKFSDGTLNDVRNALDDRLKGIRMQYLPQTIWRKGNKDRAAAMI